MNPIPSNVIIFIATHKAFTLPTDEKIYLPIQVGKNKNLDYFSENQLDNIAEKNPNFCELTILYFIWKNISASTVGLVHYRRYFGIKQHSLMRKWHQFQYYLGLKPKYLTARYRIATQSDLAPILQKCDMIVPEARYLDKTIYDDYAHHHHIQDWHIVQKIIAKQCPEYLPTFHHVEQNHLFYPCNMFIGKKEVLQQYCQWIFDILFEAEKHIDFSNYNDYNKRVFGFLAERLFTIWIIHNQQKFKFHHLPIFTVET